MNPFVLAAALGLSCLATSPLSFAQPPATAKAAQEGKADATAPAPNVPMTADEIAGFAKQIHDGAAADAVRVLEKHPAVVRKDPDADIIYGLALYFTGRLRDAHNVAFKYQGAAASTNPYLLKLVGYSMLGEDNPTGAITFFKLGSIRDPKDAEFTFNVLRCDAMIHPNLEALNKAKAFDARKGELPKGLFETAISDCSLRVANKMVADKKVGPETYELLESACVIAPDNVDVPTLLAILCVESKDFDKAEAILTKMEKQFDNKIEIPQFLRGRIAEKKGDYKEALAFANVSARLSNRKYLPALLLVARMAIQLDQLDDARRALDSAINVAPDNYEARTMLAHYLIERSKTAKDQSSRREFLKQAEENCFIVQREHKYDPAVCQDLVEIYTLFGESKKNELEAAKLDLERAKSMHP